jgi:esterase/lipase
MIAIVLLVLLLPMLYLYLKPLNAAGLAVSGNPALNYADALQSLKELKARDAGNLDPNGDTILLTHGKKTDKVIVLLHGYTKSPFEFHRLGQLLFARGYNVLIPRMPHHGLANRMTNDQALLTAEEIAVYANTVVDIAHGLGEHVTVAGLSAGGLTTAWIAQNRADVEKAVVMSPVFGYKQVPTAVTRPVMNAYLTLPNDFKWWDEKLKEKVEPTFYYPRWSTHALAQLLRLSFATQQKAAEQSPAAQSILVVTNANDASVNNEMTTSVVQNWRKHAPEKVNTFEFPASDGLDHDFIDPDMPKQKTATTYPRLLELLTRKNH